MKQILFALVLSWAGLQVNAQSEVPRMHRWQARADLYHQNWAGDFRAGSLGVFDHVYIRPGIRVGMERTWAEAKHFRFYQDFLIGYYHNTYDELSFTLGTDIGVEWRLWRELRLGFPLGLHFHRAKPIDIRYEYDGEKWVKAKNTDPAISRLQVPVGLNLGWRLWPQAAHPMDAFLHGGLSLIGPWQPGSGVSVLAYRTVGVGVRVGI